MSTVYSYIVHIYKTVLSYLCKWADMLPDFELLRNRTVSYHRKIQERLDKTAQKCIMIYIDCHAGSTANPKTERKRNAYV